MNIKKFFFVLMLSVLLLNDIWSQANFQRDLNSNEFTPDGWVKEFLDRQVEGLGGHPEESGFPFNTKMWTENMDYKDREIPGGSDWWPYEQTAYYLDGTLRCAYLTGSSALMKKADANLTHIVATADENGIMHAGDIGFEREGWPMVVIMRMLVEKYEATKDLNLLAVIEKHYKAIYSNEDNFKVANMSGFEIRPVLHVELLGALYNITQDKWYLNAAEKLYAAFQNQAIKSKEKNKDAYIISAKAMNEGLKPGGHAVTYHEFLKLPAILYKYTGKEEYKKAVYTAYGLLEKEHELADGGASNHEALAGKGPNESTEACSLIDFNWTTGWTLLATSNPRFADKMEKVLYNAAFSLISKDFKAYQYYQMPNLLISTNASSFFNDNVKWGAYAKGRLCYRPGHDTECCAGNIHRMLPTFITRSCLVEGNVVKVAMYLPGTVNTTLQKGVFSFTQQTNYPFGHDVKILINKAPSSKVSLGLRIPKWVDSYTISVNGKNFISGDDNTIFKTIIRKFKKGDEIELAFKTSPKIDDRGSGIAINYGPLVFSYPIESTIRKITSDPGKKCSPEFPAYEYMPKNMHNWAIALSENITSNDIEVVKTKTSGYPWDYGNSPVKLKVKAKTVSNWILNGYIEPEAYPDILELDKDRAVELVPESTTALKITEFPKGDF